MDKDGQKEEEEIKKMEESLFSDSSEKRPEPDSKEEKRKKEIGQEIGLVKRKEEKSHDSGEVKHITLKVNPERAKTILLILVILALFTFSFIYNPFYNMIPWMGDNNESENEITGAAVGVEEEEIELNETEEEVNETEEDEFDVEEEEEEIELNETEEEVNETEEDDLELSGEVTVTIDNYTTAISNSSGTGKVTSVSVTVDNGLELFIPKIKIWVYDDETKDAYQLPAVAVVEIFEELKPGQLLKATIDTRKFLFANDNLEEEKTIMVKVYDEGEKTGTAKDRLLARTEKDINIEESD